MCKPVKETPVLFGNIKEINEPLIITLGYFCIFFSSLVCIHLRTVIGSNDTLCFSYVIKFFLLSLNYC